MPKIRDKDVILRQMLYLRYQNPNPVMTVARTKPIPTLPMSIVSELLNVPLETLNWLNR